MKISIYYAALISFALVSLALVTAAPAWSGEEPPTEEPATNQPGADQLGANQPSVGEATSDTEESSERRSRINLSSLHPVAQAVARAGAPACALKTHEAVFFLIAETESGAMVHFRSRDLFSFSFESTDFEGMTSYASLYVSPGKEDHCAISYEIVTYWPQDCGTVAKENYSDMMVGDVLREKLRPLSMEEGPHVFMLPTNGSCVVIKKEIIP